MGGATRDVGFTGLRVGMAAVMGFSAATDKPMVGVSSLEATAFAAAPASTVCAVVNAYKGEVYSQLFSFDGEGVPVPRNDPMMSTVEKAIDRVADRTFLFSPAMAPKRLLTRSPGWWSRLTRQALD